MAAPLTPVKQLEQDTVPHATDVLQTEKIGSIGPNKLVVRQGMDTMSGMDDVARLLSVTGGTYTVLASHTMTTAASRDGSFARFWYDSAGKTAVALEIWALSELPDDEKMKKLHIFTPGSPWTTLSFYLAMDNIPDYEFGTWDTAFVISGDAAQAVVHAQGATIGTIYGYTLAHGLNSVASPAWSVPSPSADPENVGGLAGSPAANRWLWHDLVSNEVILYSSTGTELDRIDRTSAGSYECKWMTNGPGVNTYWAHETIDTVDHLYCRTLLTSGDTLSWASTEHDITTVLNYGHAYVDRYGEQLAVFYRALGG